MSKGVNFLIRKATRLDYNLIRYGLKRFYWPVDPLSLTWKNQRIPSFLEYKWTMTQVLNGHNLIVFDENNLMNNFIGFVVNTKWTKTKTNELLKLANDTKDNRLIAIALQQNYIEMKTDIYNKFNVNEIFLINNIGVHPEYLRKHLGTQLVEQSLERAKELGYKMAVINASGEYLIKICENIGMSKIDAVQYSSILDENNKKLRMFDCDNDKEFCIFIRKFKI